MDGHHHRNHDGARGAGNNRQASERLGRTHRGEVVTPKMEQANVERRAQLTRKEKGRLRAMNYRTYIIWCAMKQRCYNKKHSAFSRYGGRGIKVCDRWRNS